MITIKVEHKDVTKMLGELQARIKNLTPAMKIIGRIVRDSIVKNFEAGGRPAKWKPSARAQVKGDKTLIASSRLMNSIASRGHSNKAEIGTNVVYAAIHQFGGKTKPHVIEPRNAKALKIPGIGFRKRVNHPGSKIPARPFLMVQEEDWTEIKNTVQDYLLKK